MKTEVKTSQFEGERIAKAIARSGLCSRRDAERLISEGRVTVNGEKLTSPARNVTAADIVLVNGKTLPALEQPRLWRYHKPEGLLVSHKDPKGRPTVFEKLREQLPRVVSVGRLDFNTEGLLLLTNDGELARRLELPSNDWLRRYRVRVWGEIEPEDLAKLKAGVVIEGVKYGEIEAALDSRKGENAWLTFAIREGKNREVRKVCEHLGLQVNRLIRTAYGPFQLGGLERGGIEEVHPKVMRDQLGRVDGGSRADRRRAAERA